MQSGNILNPEVMGLKELVAKLKPEQKIVLDLVYFRGFTHLEVSEELEIPLGTVKTRLRNAIITLRKLFN
jgi:RNA polymerase sigma-70 factor (ECF subfamily)